MEASYTFSIDKKTHTPNAINFFQPRLAIKVIRAYAVILPIVIKELKISKEEMQPLLPAKTEICWVTTIGFKWLSPRSILLGLSSMERASLLSLTLEYGAMSS